MSHNSISDLVHRVFSTKLRKNLISPEIQPELWSFLGGVARKNRFKALMVGGTENHVHILLSLPATMPVAKALQLRAAICVGMNQASLRDAVLFEGPVTRRWSMNSKRWPFGELGVFLTAK